MTSVPLIWSGTTQGTVPKYYYNKSIITVIMEKTILLIAAVVVGLCALEAVDLYFTMLLYSGQLP
jgi:hypothetical protein